MRSEQRTRWPLVPLAVVGVLTLANVGGRRDFVAGLIVLAVIGAIIAVLKKRAAAPKLTATILVVAALVTPWVFGLAANTLQGWQDHIWHWGRYYNASRVAPSADSVAAGRPLSLAELLAGSTWVADPLVAADVRAASTVLVVSMPSGKLVSYELVGGP